MRCSNPVQRYIQLDCDGKWRQISKPTAKSYRHVTYPCGHCFACRVNHAKHWAARCTHEFQTSGSGFFLNLTVNDYSLPKLFTPFKITPRIAKQIHSFRLRNSYKPSAGFSFDSLKEGVVYSLDHSPIQLFLKRLRRALPGRKIRYLVAGEYGPSNYRPHYHLVIFGFRPDDLVPYTIRGQYVLYRSKFIESLWSDPNTGESYGYSTIGSISPASCQYVAQYSVKKIKGVDDALSFYGPDIKPEYLRCSQGLGRDWISKYHDEVLANSGTIVLAGKQFCSIPRYYIKWLRQNEPSKYDEYRLSTGKEEFLDAWEQRYFSPSEQFELDIRDAKRFGNLFRFYQNFTDCPRGYQGYYVGTRRVTENGSRRFHKYFQELEEAERVTVIREIQFKERGMQDAKNVCVT